MTQPIQTKKNEYVRDGEEYSRVTSILSILPSWGLDWWKQEKVAQAAILAMEEGKPKDDVLKIAMKGPDNASKEARERGTLVHELLQKVNHGELIDLNAIEDEEARGIVTQWMKYLKESGIKTQFTERTLFSEKYKIAGTLDLFGEKNGKLFVGDIKTGNVYAKAFVQLSAYNEFLKENGLTTDNVHLVVFDVSTDGVKTHTPESFFKKGGRNAGQECHIPTHEELFIQFRCALMLYRFDKLKVGKFEYLVKEFSELSKDTAALMKGMEEYYVRENL